jgi:hypothetical protein
MINLLEEILAILPENCETCPIQKFTLMCCGIARECQYLEIGDKITEHLTTETK